MIFKKQRNLTNKVFGTKIEFVDFGERDSVGAINKESKELEQALVEDFGAPTVLLGGEFIGHAKLVDGVLSLVEESDVDATCITFVLSSSSTLVTTGFVAEMIVDSKKQSLKADSKLTSEQVAEAKCLIFEEEITKRLEEVILALKAKLTTFETEVLEEIVIPVPKGSEHTHA